MNAALSVRHLSHKYARDWAIQDVHFDIDEPGIYGLLGANGAGKSTTMNIVCGVLYPTKGDALIGGNSIRTNPIEAKKELGFLPQQAPLYPEFTVDEYLVHCARLRRMDRASIRPAVDEAKERVGVSHFSRRLIGALSGGYLQRVGLAQAILHRPGLVVLDEPTNGLDPVQILAVRELIREIAEDCTVLLSTHILPEVEALCNEIKMIDHGRIVFEGTMDEYANVVEPTSLIAVFKDPPETDALLEIPGVKAATSINAQKRRLQIEVGTPSAEAVVAASARNEWRLQELYAERSTLEEVFANLSNTAS